MAFRSRCKLSGFMLFAVVFLLATATLAQQSAPAAKDFAGTWHWIFQGKPFVTMVLVYKGDGFSGSVSNGSIHTDAKGKITDVEGGSGSATILRSSMENGVLHIWSKDGDDENEWAITLTSSTTADIKPGGADAPANFETIHAQKAP